MKLRKGNVFIHICLSGRRGGDPHTGTPPPPPSPLPQPSPPADVLKFVQLWPHCTGSQCPDIFNLYLTGQYPPTSKHVQTCSLCSPDCWQAGGWHLTEMPSCLFWFSLSTTNTNPDLLYGTIIWCIKEIVAEHQCDPTVSEDNYLALY